MLALEIDEALPDTFEALPVETQVSIRESFCCRCERKFGKGKIIMYVAWEKGDARWWHYVSSKNGGPCPV